MTLEDFQKKLENFYSATPDEIQKLSNIYRDRGSNELTQEEIREKLKSNVFSFAIRDKEIHTFGRKTQENLLVPYDKRFWKSSVELMAQIYQREFKITPDDKAAVLYEPGSLAGAFYNEALQELGLCTIHIPFSGSIREIDKLLQQLEITVIQTIPLVALMLSQRKDRGQVSKKKAKIVCSSVRKARGLSMPVSKALRERLEERFEFQHVLGTTETLLIGYGRDDWLTLIDEPELITFEFGNSEQESSLKRLSVNVYNPACALYNYFTKDLVEVKRSKEETQVKFCGRVKCTPLSRQKNSDLKVEASAALRGP